MRRILRIAKLAMVMSIVFMMTVDTANACRLFQWVVARRAAPTDCVQYTTTPYASAPSYDAPISIVSDGVAGGCCSASVPAEQPMAFPVPSGMVVDDSSVIHEGTVVESYPVETGEPVYEASPAEVSPIDSAPADVITEETTPVPDTPIAVEEPTEAANPLDIAAEETTSEEVTKEEAATSDEVPAAPDSDDLFGGDDAEPATEPDTPADDDLFGGDDAEPAAEPDAPAADDLFGGDDAEPAAEPDAPAADDLFGGDDEPVDDLFEGGDAEPAAEPAPDADAPDTDAPDADDLFGGDEPVEDLFGGDDAQPASDQDLFGGEDAPADNAAPADGDPSAGEDASDLFEEDTLDLFEETPAGEESGANLFRESVGDVAPATNEAPAEEPVEQLQEVAPPAVEEAPIEEDTLDESDIDDLFSRNRKGLRQWTDDTGTYRTIGRLVVIAKTHVRLLKENGRHCTVPLERLSRQDLEYVMAVAKKLAGSQRIASR